MRSVSSRERPLTRRAWLAMTATALGCPRNPSLAGDPDPDDEAIERYREMAEKAGISPSRGYKTPHFLAMGNAPADLLILAAKTGEHLRREFFSFFPSKGFRLQTPSVRLPIVALSTESVFRRFTHDHDPIVQGRYLAQTNQIIIYDFRTNDTMSPEEQAEQRTRCLRHEILHQLTYNTGVLNRSGTQPTAISEGLAFFGEEQDPRGRVSGWGGVNNQRCDSLLGRLQDGARWIPVEELILDNFLYNDTENPAEQWTAYEESWLLVHHCLTNNSMLPRFRKYLDAIYPRRDRTHDRDDVESHLGDLKALDTTLKRYLESLSRRSRFTSFRRR
jgi:hypothetical protein